MEAVLILIGMGLFIWLEIGVFYLTRWRILPLPSYRWWVWLIGFNRRHYLLTSVSIGLAVVWLGSDMDVFTLPPELFGVPLRFVDDDPESTVLMGLALGATGWHMVRAIVSETTPTDTPKGGNATNPSTPEQPSIGFDG